ncbi:MAG TPA: flagellar basal body-associated FliL family protein [Fimbriimonas sp.]|nr:flagellar basal body-associated FliL family protein [Fimbriimonas sp.]
MSEAPKEEGTPKKKGGKLPIIIAVVLMLGGGGFFMTKKKGGKVEKPAVKLAKEEIVLPDEFIVNMSDGQTYVRAKIGLRGKDGFKAESVTAHDSEVSDAIITILKSAKPQETATPKGVKGLKLKIAAALNKIFIEEEKAAHPDEGHDDEKDKKKKKKKKKKSDEESDEHGSSGHDEESDEEEEEEELEIPDGWDSAEGPILKVFFKSLATQ